MTVPIQRLEEGTQIKFRKLSEAPELTEELIQAVVRMIAILGNWLVAYDRNST